MISPDLNRYCSDFTRKRAAEYDVTGWVRNTVDGCVSLLSFTRADFPTQSNRLIFEQVEGQAQGKEESVEKLLQDLKQGPPAAQVMKLEKSTVDTLKEESRFSVVR